MLICGSSKRQHVGALQRGADQRDSNVSDTIGGLLEIRRAAAAAAAAANAAAAAAELGAGKRAELEALGQAHPESVLSLQARLERMP